MNAEILATLKEIEDRLSRIAPRSGSLVDGAVTGKSFRYLVVQEDTVLTVATGSKSTNYITVWGISGKTLKQGCILPVYAGEVLTAVTPSSGSVFGYE